MLMRHPHLVFQFTHALPYGAIVHDGGVQFVVFSRSANEMRLLLYDAVTDREPTDVITFDRDSDRWGDVWSVFVPGVGPGQLYHFQADGPQDPQHGYLFDGKARSDRSLLQSTGRKFHAIGRWCHPSAQVRRD